MKICIFYSSPKLGDLILHLPFIKAISDKFRTKVSVCINKKIGIKKILEKQNYIDSIIENNFRRGKYFISDIFDLTCLIKKKKFTHAYILEKTKGAAIASCLSSIDNIYGFGIGSQKFFVNKSVCLEQDDLRYNYTKQSLKFLSKLDIKVRFDQNFIQLDNNFNKTIKKEFAHYKKPWVCFGVDSTETNRIWPQEKFASLGDSLIEKKIAGTIFVIHSNNHTTYFENILSKAINKEVFVDCRSLNRSEIIQLIDISNFFVGIDSGPSCVSGALNKKTFCIIGPTDATLPRFKSMYKITSDFYDNRREIGNKRCGDNFVQNNEEAKSIRIENVLDKILKNIK